LHTETRISLRPRCLAHIGAAVPDLLWTDSAAVHVLAHVSAECVQLHTEGVPAVMHQSHIAEIHHLPCLWRDLSVITQKKKHRAWRLGSDCSFFFQEYCFMVGVRLTVRSVKRCVLFVRPTGLKLGLQCTTVGV
jgi:hypothetical protein